MHLAIRGNNKILRTPPPELVCTITTATYEAVDTEQKFSLIGLKDVLHYLKDIAPGDDTV